MKKIMYIAMGIIMSYIYFLLIARPITSAYFRTSYEGVSAVMTILCYFVIVLPCILIILKKIHDKYE